MTVPDDVRAYFDESSRYFHNPLQQFVYFDKYSRWQGDRRETWIETVARAMDFLRELSHNRLDEQDYSDLHRAILNMEVMPSMRLMAMAGPAARRDNATCYNCVYLPVQGIQDFVETCHLLMAGCGVGFSVESAYVDRLPEVRHASYKSLTVFKVEDTSEGWADALKFGLETWFSGGEVLFNLEDIRPAGAPLKTKGGRASGPDHLRAILDNVRRVIVRRRGMRLRPIDAHDVMCFIAEGIVSGGVRRSAMLSLFDFDDLEMRYAKHADFMTKDQQRRYANNSVVLPKNLTRAQFDDLLYTMIDSGTGEPGIFSREAAWRTMPERRKREKFGTNACAEIFLRPYEFCNLSSAKAVAEDDHHTLSQKVRLATILGTIQSMATHFPNLRPQWKINCEEERLLGVDITGQMDSPITGDAEAMAMLKDVAVGTNVIYATKLGINPSAAVTCVKPSGNSSQLLDCSSGLHARWSRFYIRNVEVFDHSPVYEVLKEHGVPMVPKPNGAISTSLAAFPIAAPATSVTRHDLTVVDQLNHWSLNKLNWTEHNPSMSAYYKPQEAAVLKNWLWDNRGIIGGLSFYPSSDARYENAPYVEITEKEYREAMQTFPRTIDWSRLYVYEREDRTTSAREIACAGGACEI